MGVENMLSNNNLISVKDGSAPNTAAHKSALDTICGPL